MAKSAKKSKQQKDNLYSRYEMEPNEFYSLVPSFIENKKYYLYTYLSCWESDSLEFDPKIPFMLKKAYTRDLTNFFVFYSVEHNKDIKIVSFINKPKIFKKFENPQKQSKKTRQKMSVKYNQQVINDVLAYARLFKWKENNSNYLVSVNQIYTGENFSNCVSLCCKVLNIPESDVKQILKEYAGTI